MSSHKVLYSKTGDASLIDYVRFVAICDNAEVRIKFLIRKKNIQDSKRSQIFLRDENLQSRNLILQQKGLQFPCTCSNKQNLKKRDIDIEMTIHSLNQLICRLNEICSRITANMKGYNILQILIFCRSAFFFSSHVVISIFLTLEIFKHLNYIINNNKEFFCLI